MISDVRAGPVHELTESLNEAANKVNGTISYCLVIVLIFFNLFQTVMIKMTVDIEIK